MKVKVFLEQVAKRKLPLNLKQHDYGLFKNEIERTIPENHILFLRNAFVMVNTIYKPFKFYSEYTHTFNLSFKEKVALILRFFMRPTKEIYKGLWIADAFSSGYFHWFTDSLPRLITSLEFINTEEILVLIPDNLKQYRFIDESLYRFKIQPYYYSIKENLKINQLVIPSFTAPSGNYNEILIKRLREAFLKQLSVRKPERRIYISREQAANRKISNEKEVIKVLLYFGFEVHSFEEYTLDKQINIMSETEVLVSIHGAGLTNMIFMPANGKVLELRNANDSHNNCYFSLASALNLEYWYQTNTGNAADTHKVILVVDIAQLRVNLENMLS